MIQLFKKSKSYIKIQTSKGYSISRFKTKHKEVLTSIISRDKMIKLYRDLSSSIFS